ncbi:MAG: SDR family NAD(P)-dependent oxidoreductase, partial [Gemmatimonadota bacterium]|nr:SDR family NAD(P)-dependent oxidoreductase [Gemmatimonadota bacterium]
NAGIFQIAQLEEATVESYSAALATNLVAPFVFTKAFLADMRSRASGHIVTIGSVADRSIFPGNGVYSVTKFGARAMHEVLREETRGSGVRATLVSPSGVDTGIWDGVRFPDGGAPDRAGMLDRGAVAHAVLFALTQPADVNIDEMRLSRA